MIEVIKAIRKSCDKAFTLAIKLNSADFQRGGFDVEDAEKVVHMLAPLAVDLVELAERIAKTTTIPVMTTGRHSKSRYCEPGYQSRCCFGRNGQRISIEPRLAKPMVTR